MTLKRVYGSFTFLALQWDMVYGSNCRVKRPEGPRSARSETDSNGESACTIVIQEHSTSPKQVWCPSSDAIPSRFSTCIHSVAYKITQSHCIVFQVPVESMQNPTSQHSDTFKGKVSYHTLTYDFFTYYFMTYLISTPKLACGCRCAGPERRGYPSLSQVKHIEQALSWAFSEQDPAEVEYCCRAQ